MLMDLSQIVWHTPSQKLKMLTVVAEWDVVLFEVADIGGFGLQHDDGVKQVILVPMVLERFHVPEVLVVQAVNAVQDLNQQFATIFARAVKKALSRICPIADGVRFEHPTWYRFQVSQDLFVRENVEILAAVLTGPQIGSLALQIADGPKVDRLTTDDCGRFPSSANQPVIVRISLIRI